MPERSRTASGEFRIDRRVHPRLPVELRVVEVDGTTTYFRYATNVSVGGMRIDGTVPYEAGTVLTLIFIAPGDTDPTRVQVEVLGPGDADGRGMRVRFLDDEDSDLRISLRRFVRMKTQRGDDMPEEG